MQKNTFKILKNRITLINLLIMLFLVGNARGQNLPSLVPNSNEGLPILYALPDNHAEFYTAVPNPFETPLPSSSTQVLDRTFTGKAIGYRATNNKLYAFYDRSLYEIDIETGTTTFVAGWIIHGRAFGIEFYVNNTTGEEIMFVVGYPNQSNTGGRKLYAFNPNNNWAPYAGFYKYFSGDTNYANGISWDPTTAQLYVQRTNPTNSSVDFYTVDVGTASTTYAFTIQNNIEGDGIGFAADRKMYTEDDSAGTNRLLYEVTTTGNITPAANLGGIFDVEGVTGNAGTRTDGGDAPESYGWAAHYMSPIISNLPTTYLGIVPPDSENPLTIFGNGTGDDNDGDDDEEGVSLNGNLLDGQNLLLGETTTLDITTHGDGYLNAWIDWNGNGTFDATEQVATDIVSFGGLLNLTINVPANASIGASYARFRYSSETGLTASNSIAIDGETEDYQINIANGSFDWSFDCGDDKKVDEYGYNANCQQNTFIPIPDPSNIYQYAVEIIYKGTNPGNTIQFTDSLNFSHTLNRTTPFGGSHNVWVYRGIINGTTSSITYVDNSNNCSLQSVMVYAFRNIPGAPANTGEFTVRSGYNSIQYITLDIPLHSSSRDINIDVPLSELTPDGRYLLLSATAGGVTSQTFIYGPDSSLPGGNCCLAIPSLTLAGVPGTANQVVITIDTRNYQNGQSVAGQSWVMSSMINIESLCYDDLEVLLNNKENVTCFGEATGSIDITVTGGVPPYTFLWSNGATTQDLNNIPAGTYSVTVSDSIGNLATLLDTIIEQPDELIINTQNIDNVLCYGESTGAIDIAVTGGTPPYTYSWNNGATTEDLNNIPAGTYTVMVTDANGCSKTETEVIEEPNSALSLSYGVENVECNGDSSGFIDITVSGGTPPYTYSWSNGATTEDIDNIPSGTYTVIVTDANGCIVAQQGINVTEPDTLSVIITKENATTGQGCQDGEATVAVTGGTPPYSYQWSASAGNQTTATATNLPTGTHTVTVTDANGCEIEQGVVIDCINTCDAVLTVDSTTDILCTGDNTGNATVSASSAANPNVTFTFSWNTGFVETGVTSSSLNNIGAGVYTVSVTIDGTVCQPVEQSVTITEPANALNVTATATDESGPTTGDGTATATPSGGTPPYTYVWSPGGETTQTITDLSAGSYTVTVTDANGCMATATVMVNPGTCLDLSVSTTAIPVSCYGDSDGSATAVVTGGSGNISYLWNTGATTQNISGLPGGTYSVTVTDTITQCTATSSVTVNEPNELSSGIAISHVLCFGESTGSLDLTVSGGTFPYTFVWSNGATTEDINNLPAGNYTVTITDVNGCTLTNNATVTQPASALNVSVTTVNESYPGAGDGSATATVTGGTPPYSYSWSPNSETTQTITGLGTGTYTVTVTDANGCQEIITITLSSFSPSISVIKNQTNTTGVLGDTITYDIVVTNTGDIDLVNIEVTDANATIISGNPIASLAPGASATVTAEHIITQADIDQGYVENTAIASGEVPNGDPNNPNDNITDTSDTGTDTNGNTIPDPETVETPDGEGNTNNDPTDDPTVTTFPSNPSMSVIKNQTNAAGGLGDTITYDIVVTNTGNVTLSNIEVTDANATIVSGNPIASLAPGASATVTAEHIITQADIDQGYVENTAIATGDSPNGTDDVTDTSDTGTDTNGNTIPDPETVETPDGEGNTNNDPTDDPTVTILQQNPSIALIKVGTFNDEDQDGCSDVDETISYSFTVTNTGNVTLTDVMITDPLVTVSGSAITLAPGESDTTTFTASYAITQSDIDAGMVSNQATAEGTTPMQTQVSDLSDDTSNVEDDPTVTELCQSASIALIKVGTVNDENNSGCADVKETITYAFTVINTGNITITNIDIDDPLVNVVGGPITLAPGETDNTVFTATYLITQADINNGFVENQATVSGLQPNGDIISDLSDDNSELEDDSTVTDLCQSASIALIKTAIPTDENGNGCIDLAETIVYDFVIVNTGNVALSNVYITDPLVNVTGTPIDLEAGASDTETFFAVYTVTQEDIDNGFISNQATVFGTTLDGVVVQDFSDDNSILENDPTVTNTCQNPPDISIEKTGVFNDENGDGIAQEGESISYFFTVTNTGEVTLYNIILTDELPGIEIEGGPIEILEPGESDNTTFTATYIITAEDIENGEVINQAIITGEDSNGNQVSDESDDPINTTNSDIDGDGDPDDPTITTLPLVLGGAFEIFNGITPDGDGLNDFFYVFGIQEYPNNNMKIYNRWGVLVYETDGYGGTDGKQNVFRGISEGRVTVRKNEELPTGTYFYVLTFKGSMEGVDFPTGGKNKYSGYLYINK